MKVQEEIRKHIDSQSEPKRSDLQELHQTILKTLPKTKLWFFDGTDANGKVVSNPNIGYGSYMIKYANGETKEFYQIGFSSNSSGISLYIMGLGDKNYLSKTYGKTIGKASLTSYCIKFKSLKDIKMDVLKEAIKDGYKQTLNS